MKELFAEGRPASRKKVPFAFVLEELEDLSPFTRPMFGCLAVYVGEKIMLILREKDPGDPDNGVWIATFPEHHDSLREELPSLRSIEIFGGVTAWQNLPADSADFESSVLHVCELIRRGDARIGKVPKPRRSRKAKKK